MAYTIALTDLTTTINLLDKVSYKALMGLLVDPVEARVRLHIPDSGEARVVDIDDNDRVAVMPVHFLGAGDTALNSLVTVRRWIDGASSQAVRYELLGDVKPIYLKLQRNGATNATIHRIKWGRVNDASGPYSQTAHISGPVAARLTLVLAPYGELQTPIFLFSDLENGDFTLSDGGGAGSEFAAEWAGIGSTTADLDTTVWMINGQSQKLTIPAGHTGAGMTGMFSDLGNQFDFTAGDKVNGFAWVYRSSGTDDISIQIQDNNGDIPDTNSLDDPPAGWPTYTDPRGITWTRISIAVTTVGSGESSCRLRVGRIDADASEETTWYTDGAYLNQSYNTLTIPAAGWIGYSHLLNRGDRTATNPDYINHIDTWGIPGDVDAQALWKVTTGVTPSKVVLAGRMIDGTTAANSQPVWLDSTDSTAQSANVANQVDANRSGGSYAQLTAAAAPDSGSVSFAITGDTVRNLMKTPRRVYCIASSDDTTGTAKLKLSVLLDSTELFTWADTVTITNDALSEWEAVDLGILNFASVFPDSVPSTTDPSITLVIEISNVTNTKKVNIDALHLVPVEDEFIIQEITTSTPRSVDTEIWFDGPNKRVTLEERGIAGGHAWFVMVSSQWVSS